MTKPAHPAAPARAGYHHGALREALIEASDALLAERGLEGFSLREVARRSGVSPAAPAHHFGDARGLLTAVATQAFDRLTAALEAGNRRGGDDPVARMREQGLGYVEFALNHPGRFGLMFHKPFEQRLEADEELRRACHAAFAVLERGVRDLFGVSPEQPFSGVQQRALMSIWSVVHGYAHLALAGQLDGIATGSVKPSRLRAVLAPQLEEVLLALREVAHRRDRAAKKVAGSDTTGAVPTDAAPRVAARGGPQASAPSRTEPKAARSKGSGMRSGRQGG